MKERIIDRLAILLAVVFLIASVACVGSNTPTASADPDAMVSPSVTASSGESPLPTEEPTPKFAYSSGMLEVMPEFRRKGIGTELAVFFQNYQLDRGWMPSGQVYLTNTASLKMQSKLGLSVSEDCIWWIYEE